MNICVIPRGGGQLYAVVLHLYCYIQTWMQQGRRNYNSLFLRRLSHVYPSSTVAEASLFCEHYAFAPLQWKNLVLVSAVTDAAASHFVSPSDSLTSSLPSSLIHRTSHSGSSMPNIEQGPAGAAVASRRYRLAGEPPLVFFPSYRT